MGTAGFYRLGPDGLLSYAPNRLSTPTGTYYVSQAEQYQMPIDGQWHWFASEADALAYFTPPETEADAIKAEVLQRIRAVLKDTPTQINMTALATSILAKQSAGTVTLYELDTLATLQEAFGWVSATQKAGRDRIAGTQTPWPEPPLGVDDIVEAL